MSGRIAADLSERWPKFNQHRPTLDASGHTLRLLCQVWPKPTKFGPLWSKFGPNSLESAEMLPNTAKSGRAWANSRLAGQVFGNCWTAFSTTCRQRRSSSGSLGVTIRDAWLAIFGNARVANAFSLPNSASPGRPSSHDVGSESRRARPAPSAPMTQCFDAWRFRSQSGFCSQADDFGSGADFGCLQHCFCV